MRPTIATEPFGDLRDLLAHPIPETMFQTRYGLYYLHARGPHSIAGGLHHAALDDFLHCGELMCAWRLDVATLVPWRAGAAEALTGLGDPTGARAMLRQHASLAADRYARGRGASPDSSAPARPARTAADVDLTGRGTTRPGLTVASLSEAERKVAVLAARGRTNREIAAALFITVSTVEQHLTRTYRKLRVGGWRDLAACLPADPVPIR